MATFDVSRPEREVVDGERAVLLGDPATRGERERSCTILLDCGSGTQQDTLHAGSDTLWPSTVVSEFQKNEDQIAIKA